jgi:hypothetical protein
VSSGLDSLFLANFKKNLQRLLEFGSQFLGVLAIKVSATIEAKNLTAKEIQIFVVLDLGVIALNCHYVHGSTPCCSSHLRTLATAPLSVLGEGCGL